MGASGMETYQFVNSLRNTDTSRAGDIYIYLTFNTNSFRKREVEEVFHMKHLYC